MKKKSFLILAAAALALASCNNAPKVAPAIPQDNDIESKVEKILKDMTLEEKVGQMTQITATAIANGLDITPAGDSITSRMSVPCGCLRGISGVQSMTST